MKADQPTTDEADSLPEYMYVVPDIDDSDGYELWERHGEIVADTPVITLRRYTWEKRPPTCEKCEESAPDAYQLAHDWAGPAVCRDCWESSDAVAAVVESEGQLSEIDQIPPELENP